MRIGHYLRNIVGEGGAIAYMARLMAAQRAQGHEVIRLGLARTAKPGVAPEVLRVDDERELALVAQRAGVDVLHLHGPVRPGIPSDLPMVCTIHGREPYCPARTRYLVASDRNCDVCAGFWTCTRHHLTERCERRRPGKILRNWAGLRAERRQLMAIPLICPSPYVFAEMRRAGYPAVSLNVVPHAHFGEIPPYVRPPEDSPFVDFLFLGRMAPEKGLRWLLHAFARTSALIRLHVGGDGPERSAMTELARTLGVADRVIFHGWVGAEQRDQLLAQSRALIVPSTGPETFGLVVLEAFAMGRAVIAAQSGALPDVVTHKKTGLCVSLGDTSALAASINDMVRDHKQATEMGRSGRQELGTRFSQARHLAAIMGVYDRAARLTKCA